MKIDPQKAFDVLAKATAAAEQLLDATGKLATTNAHYAQRVVDAQLELAAGTLRLGWAQLQALPTAAEPEAILQRGMEGAQALQEPLRTYAEELRAAATEAQGAWTALGKDWLATPAAA